jgi:hypothetical protein
MGSIHKFRTFEEADEALYCFEPDYKYFERVARLWAFVDSVCPRKYSRGIFRYRSIEEANDQTEEWLQANAELVRRNRAKKSMGDG